jgi:hypothetical protein
MHDDQQDRLRPVNGQRGLQWGPFTTRIPFLHTRVTWPELLQGVFVAGATGLGLVPVLQFDFGLTFHEAVAFVIVQSLLICSAPIIFGEPYAPGWITPALPLALLVLLSSDGQGDPLYATATERFQFMTAVSLNFTALLILLGITGLGRRLIQWLPLPCAKSARIRVRQRWACERSLRMKDCTTLSGDCLS